MVLLLIALFGENFYQRKEWKDWHSEAGIIGLAVSGLDAKFGKKGVQIFMVILSFLIASLGLWILSLR
ncbi:MAG: hypothetical protein EA353_13010 [Puniceicoccaceae bacterium]|nr:MAG: hypothetical protein EA353_13010 [Puniceicoccaceae bacterium]